MSKLSVRKKVKHVQTISTEESMGWLLVLNDLQREARNAMAHLRHLRNSIKIVKGKINRGESAPEFEECKGDAATHN